MPSFVDVVAEDGVVAAIEDGGLDTLVHWLGGARLGERADEPELRLEAAREARDEFPDVGAFDRLLAAAILALPPDHPERDLALARRLLDDHLRASREQGDEEEEIRTIADLLSSELLRPEEAVPLLGTQAGDEPGRARFAAAAESYCRMRQIAARDAGDLDAMREWQEREAEFAADDEDVGSLLSRAARLDMAERYEEAADCYRQVIEQTDLEDPAVQQFALREAELRLITGDPDGCSEVLAEALPRMEARYLDAVRDEDVSETGERLSAAVDCLAIAQARGGRWSDVCTTLDRTRGLRLRRQAAARDERVVAAERELLAAMRGAPDAPPPAGLLEEYRRARPAAADLASPSGEELAGALDDGEAVAFVAHHFSGTVVALAVGGGVTGLLLDDWRTEDWILLFAEGWIDVLADPAAAEPGAGLEELIDGADDVVGHWLRERLDEHGATRVTVLAEDILRLIPWWALPSLEELGVAAAGSAADLVRARLSPDSAAPRTALVVADPTLDLPVTGMACERIAATLRGFDTATLHREQATEAALAGALPGRTLLHFGGHGRSDVAYSALELHPGRGGPDPFPAWMARAGEWRSPEEDEDDEDAIWERRWADVPGLGRLHERRWLASGRVDRWLEHADGTLAASYAGERCVRVAELWSAADLLVGDAMHDCRLAVLSACQSALGGRGEDFRALGLPEGLAFAGVGTVVGTLWPVEEALAVLWTELFYGELAAASGEVDVPALARRAAAGLREMTREDAEARLLAIADAGSDPIAAFALEAYAAGLGDPPFADPWHWSAFYVTGRPTIRFEDAR